MAKKRVESKKTAAKGRVAKRPGGNKVPVKSPRTRAAAKKVAHKKPARQPKRTVKKVKRIASTPTVVTIVFSNHDYVEVVGSANAPYFNQLIAAFGLATNYHDSGVRPSLPNYLVLVSGNPQYPVALHVNLDKMPELRRETFTA